MDKYEALMSAQALHSQDKTITFQRARGERIFFAVMMGVGVITALLMPSVATFSGGEMQGRVFCGALACLFAGAGLWLSAPREITLDASRHLYRGRRGWRLYARPVSGPLSDIEKFVIRSARGKHGEIIAMMYSLEVQWRDTRRKTWTTLEYMKMERAYAVKAQLEKAGMEVCWIE